MLKVLFFITITTSVLANSFGATFQNDIIDDFSIVNNRVYIATPKRTYLLNSTLSIIDEFAKNFTKSMLFYANSDFLLECGENATHADNCCYLRDPQTLTAIATTNDGNLCYQFQQSRFHYPCLSPKIQGIGTSKFYMLISFYKIASQTSGAFSRIWFNNINNGQLTYQNMKIDFFDSRRFRPKVISPAFPYFKKFVVMKKSSHYKEAYYINPDIEISKSSTEALNCDDSNADVSLGFGLAGNAQSKVVDIVPTSADDLTHIVLFKNDSNYRICSYTEEEMATGAELFKNSLFYEDSDSGIIESFNGRLINNEIVVLYSIGKDVYKLVFTEGDSTFGYPDPARKVLYTAEHNINKLEFYNDELVLASSNSTIFSFVPHNCGDFADCKSCTELNDPHCGWCTLQDKCTTLSQCTIKPDLWTKTSSQCLEINIVDKDVMSGIDLEVSALNINLPSDLKYTCKFNSSEKEVHITNGTYSGEEIRCSVPDFERIYSGHMELNVNIYYEDVSIGEDKVNYHRCDLYSECSECSKVEKFCAWCPLEGRCSKIDDAICHEYKVTDSTRCPVITEIQPSKLSRDTIINVVVNVSFLPQYQLSAPVYQCMISSRSNNSLTRHFEISDTDSTNSTIFCDGVRVQNDFPEYHTNQSDIDISIVYGARDDDPGVIVVTNQLAVYSCGLLASDCVQCVADYSKDYNCRFCTNSCAYSSDTLCENESIADTSTCLARNTEIVKIIPDWSPGEGGVPITIIGKSLAIAGNIDIYFVYKDGGSNTTREFPCQNSRIIDSTQLVCTTPNSLKELKLQLLHVPISTTIKIKYEDGSQPAHKSDKQFYFTPLDIDQMLPSRGPESGGTLIRVNGSKICVPEYTSVTVGDGSACTEVNCDLETQTLDCVTPPGSGNQSVTVSLGAASLISSEEFSYGADPVVDSVSPDCTLLEGGLNITVSGSNFDIIESPQLIINNVGSTPNKRSTCDLSDVTLIETADRSNNKLIFTLPGNMSESYSYSFKMDGVTELCQAKRTMSVLDAPIVISNNFEFEGGKNNTLSCQIDSPCHINMTMTQIHRFGDQVTVTVGGLKCHNSTVKMIEESEGQIGRFVCVVPTLKEVKDSLFGPEGRTKRALLGSQETDRFPVKLKIGLYEQKLGWLAYVEKGFQMLYIYVGAGVVAIFMIIFIVLVVKNRHDKHHIIDLEKKHQKEMDNVEATYAKAARQEFTELTLMTEHTANIKIDPREIPYRIYSDYLVHIMFPNVDKKKILNNLQLEQCEVPDYNIQEFRKFLNNQQFLITFINVIERQREFQVAHRCEVASYLTIALYSDFSYLSKILFTLLDTLIANDVNKTPKLLLRATKSVAEKLLTNWLSLALYDYLCTMTGPSLYDLCYKILLTVELGPLDFVTHQARFALSQDKILSEEVDFKKLEVQAEGPDGTRAKNPVTVLDCDTITQVKGKLYRAIYRHQPYSQQPSLETLSLLWTPQSRQAGQTQQIGSMELCDYDERMTEMGAEKKFNTLKSYKVQSEDLLTLTMFNDYHQAPMSTIRSVKRQTVSEVSRYHLVKNINSDMDFRSPAVNKRQTSSSSTTKIASEAYLPSLIRTKEHLSKVLDSMMHTVFMESNNIPAAIKCLFDYLDSKTDLLSERDRQDPEIAHVWKTNSLPLRFWINIIKNPQFLFDIEKPPIMDSYLSVIGQCFMDSFSLATMTLNKDSSANKLVYNKEVNSYRKAVDKWYRDVRHAPPVNLRAVVNDSKLPALPFRTKFAVSQLFNYARKYQSEIAAALPTQGQQYTRSDFEVLTKPRS